MAAVMRLGVVIPAYKRSGLLDVALKNLAIVKELSRRRIMVVVVGNGLRDVVRHYGFAYLEHPNEPLGRKVNAGYEYIRHFDPDAVMALGSDNLVNVQYCDHVTKLIRDGMDYVGALDCHFYDAVERRMIHWQGYDGLRRGETIGAGRCLSHRLLDELNWEPFVDTANSSLDAGLTGKVRRIVGVRSQGFVLSNVEGAALVDVKTKVGITPMSALDGEEVEFPEYVMAQWFSADVASRVNLLDECGEYRS